MCTPPSRWAAAVRSSNLSSPPSRISSRFDSDRAPTSWSPCRTPCEERARKEEEGGGIGRGMKRKKEKQRGRKRKEDEGRRRKGRRRTGNEEEGREMKRNEEEVQCEFIFSGFKLLSVSLCVRKGSMNAIDNSLFRSSLFSRLSSATPSPPSSSGALRPGRSTAPAPPPSPPASNPSLPRSPPGTPP